MVIQLVLVNISNAVARASPRSQQVPGVDALLECTLVRHASNPQYSVSGISSGLAANVSFEDPG